MRSETEESNEAGKRTGCLGVPQFTRRFFESGKKVAEKGFRNRFAAWLKELPKPCGLLAAKPRAFRSANGGRTDSIDIINAYMIKLCCFRNSRKE